MRPKNKLDYFKLKNNPIEENFETFGMKFVTVP